MESLTEIALSVLSSSERRLEVVAQNVANGSTSGYKSQVSFQDVIGSISGEPVQETVGTTDFTQGAIKTTGNPFDFAISGEGFFQFATSSGLKYSRQGQLTRTSDGHLANTQGWALQASHGGDLILPAGDLELSETGVFTQDGLPVGQIAVYGSSSAVSAQSVSGSVFEIDDATLKTLDQSIIRQGAIEGANVVMADEMMTMMEAVRQAEVGARIVQTYDSMMGQAISVFGQKG